MVCDACQVELGPPSSQLHHWTLNCNTPHVLCAPCFASFIQLPSHERVCPCQQCDQYPSKYVHSRYTKKRAGGFTEEKTENVLLHYSNVPTVTLLNPGSLPKTVHLTEDATDDPENCSILRELFSNLHIPLLAHSRQPSGTAQEDTAKERSLEDQLSEMVNNDKSVLFQCLHSLALGNDASSTNTNRHLKSQVFMAAENIRHASKFLDQHFDT